jgi:WD40 repeat protein
MSLWFIPISASAGASASTPGWAGQIQPMFKRHCLGCHNQTTPNGGLSLETHAGLMRGGKRGAAIVPGRSGESRLVGMVEGRLQPKMPPAGPGLTAGEIRALKAWIDAGAKTGVQDPGRREPAPAGQRPPDVPDIRPVVPVSAPIGAVAYSPDGRLLAVGGYRQVWLVSGGLAVTHTLAGFAGPVTSLAFSRDGRLLAVAGGASGQFGEIQLWDVRSRKRVRTLKGHRDAIYSVAFSPDGRTLAAASYDRLVSLWSTTGGPPRMLKDHIDAVYAVAFSPDGRRVASASGDRTIKVWDVASGRRLYTLSEPAAEQYAVAFSPDGRRLAAAGADKMLRIWNVTPVGGSLSGSAFAHEGEVLRVLFTPDGRSLLTTGEDRRVKVWDVATLTERRVLERQPDWAPALALSPDARRLAIGRLDGSLAVYDFATGRRLQSLQPQHAAVVADRPAKSGRRE